MKNEIFNICFSFVNIFNFKDLKKIKYFILRKLSLLYCLK